ncbi:MAG: T9SS type A sorting domain-containing protein [Reichenbachiella sp.]
MNLKVWRGLFLGTLSFLIIGMGLLDEQFFIDLDTEKLDSDTKITWSQYGPGNAGYINFLRYHPTLPNVCIMSPDMGNTYQTDNSGTSWYTVKDFDGTSDFFRLNDVYYSTNTESFGLAIEKARLYRTDDTGKSWQNVKNCPWYHNDSEGNDTRSWYTKVSALAIDPNNDQVWYVGGGAHPRGQQHLAWNSMTKANAANPRGADHDYSGKIWRTDNGGSSWTLVSTGLDNKSQFCRIIVNPNNSNVVFAASTYGLYKSEDKGANWVDIGNGVLDNNTIMDMDAYFNPTTNEFVLYVIDQVRYSANGTTTSNSGGIFKSQNSGVSWSKINGNLYLDINRLSGGVPNYYYKFVAKWLGISTDEAKANYPVLPTQALQYFNSLNVDPSDKNTLYVGFYDAQIQYSFTPGRLWQTKDRGENWVSVARDFGPAWSNDHAYWSSRNNPYNDNMNEGHYLTPQQWGNDYPLRSLRHCAVSSNGDVMLLYAHNTFLSTDKGVTWNQVDEDQTVNGNIMGRGDSNLPGEAVFQDRRMEGEMYLATGEHKLWKSTSDGDPGRRAVKFLENSQETVTALAYHPYDVNTLYTTSLRQHHMDKIMKSVDAGLTWEVWGQATDGESFMRTKSMLIDPINPNNMYFGVTDLNEADIDKIGGFFASTDAGKGFSRRNTGLPSLPWIEEVVFDPRDENYASFFAALPYNQVKKQNGGLYFTNDRGTNWEIVNIPDMIAGVNSVEFDHTGRMYITGGRRHGGFENGGAWFSDDYGDTWSQIFKNELVKFFAVSPFDHNLLLCTVGVVTKNPGLYLSEDRGLTWTKNNRIIGQPDNITDIQFDIYDPTQIHLTVVGSGFYDGIYTDTNQSRKITLSPGYLNLDIEETIIVEMLVEGLDENEIVFKSANTSVALVSQEGKIKGVKQGAVRVYATSADGRYSDFVDVVVSDELYDDPDDVLEVSDLSDIQVYPNPVQQGQELKIEGLRKERGRIQILSLSGLLLQEYDMNGQSYWQLSTSEMNPGIYLIRMECEEQIQIQKVLIQ